MANLKGSKTRKKKLSSREFFKLMNEFDFTTMIPHVDLFSFVFWKKFKNKKNITKLADH